MRSAQQEKMDMAMPHHMTAPAAIVTTGPSRESRADPRQRTLFAVGRLALGSREHVCTVRNISDGGIGIEIDLPLDVGTAVEIEMRGLPPTAAHVRWMQGRTAGLAFDERMAVDLSGASSRHVLRSPRFAFDRAVDLSIDGVVRPARALDIALGGMKLGTDAAPAVGTPVTVSLGGGATLRGRACWQAKNALGVRFAAPLSAVQLAEILSA